MSGNDVTIDVQRPAPEENGSDPLVAGVKRYMRMLEAGNAPPLSQYLADYSAIADEIGPAIEGLLLVHRAGRPILLTAFPESDQEWRPNRSAIFRSSVNWARRDGRRL